MRPTIVLVAQSKTIRAPDLVPIANALEIQLNQHAAPAWDRSGEWAVKVGSKPAGIGVYPIHILDRPDEEGLLGYHTESSKGLIWGRVFTKPIFDAGGSIMDGPTSVSSVLSHEALEIWGDRACNVWAEAPDGSLYAHELCDAVENDAYPIFVAGLEISVSNFCLPAWFDHHGKGKVDYLGRLKKPFTISDGGYAMVRKDGAEEAIFGEKYAKWRREMRRLHRNPSRRIRQDR